MRFQPRKSRILLAVIAGLMLGGSLANAQAVDSPQQTSALFRGIHRHLGIHGGPETVTVTDGKTYLRVTEQEYRERGYEPEFKHLPTIIVQRLPVRVRIPPGVDVD